jgi:hypothetical protein
MNAYKFLLADRVSPFSGVAWPAEGWIEANGPLMACRSGIHACRPRDLAYWLTEHLWQVELDGEVIDHELKVVAKRARLLRPIAAWDAEAQRDFVRMCLGRVVHHAAVEAAEAVPEHAAALASAGQGDDLEAVRHAARALEAALPQEARVAGRLAGFVEDAVDWIELPPAALAYVAAHAADSRSGPIPDDPFVAERALQSRWLAERLRLD